MAWKGLGESVFISNIREKGRIEKEPYLARTFNKCAVDQDQYLNAPDIKSCSRFKIPILFASVLQFLTALLMLFIILSIWRTFNWKYSPTLFASSKSKALL